MSKYAVASLSNGRWALVNETTEQVVMTFDQYARAVDFAASLSTRDHTLSGSETVQTPRYKITSRSDGKWALVYQSTDQVVVTFKRYTHAVEFAASLSPADRSTVDVSEIEAFAKTAPE